ncbi:hypothetical protein AVEN_195665-1 [Araneus ventricosus]|uniref:Histone-lysine N-methyltransferase SETMAR n=1 Tax=Araneus ventricosus TaxID=182803 RepID=A0A4Y2B8F8_ARAVE|nr:hypothetical protein AVEN_195665-1 [Araneus ventricosus]
MVGRIDAPAKCLLHSVIRFLQAVCCLWKTISAAVFCQTLGRRRAILTSGVVLIHDNARPHICVLIQQLMEQFKWEASDHLAYSPDLAASDFFTYLKRKTG